MKVFLSHSSLDKKLVRSVGEEFCIRNCCFDEIDIEKGEDIPEKVNEGLKQCTHFILFWSKNIANSSWVSSELNASFVLKIKCLCKIFIFTLDNYPLPQLIEPFKYDKIPYVEDISQKNIEKLTTLIVNKVVSEENRNIQISRFVGRIKEIGDIEKCLREQECKVIILSGFFGIGKTLLTIRSLKFLYNNSSNYKVIDFSRIPGLAELSLEFANKLNKDLVNDNKTREQQEKNIEYYIEVANKKNIVLIFKDIVNWLNDDGSFDDDLSKIISYHLKIATHPLFITSTRYINVNNSFVEAVRQLKISGMQNKDIAIIIKNNLLNNFNGKDAKNKYIANLLHGYPLGAKLVAYRISKDGYEHCTKQLARIKEINIGLAKKLISHARLSENCIVYLKIMALCKSRLYNEEYKNAIPSLSSHILKSSDEAHFAGFTKFDDEGYYVLEPIVKDYFYELAFNDPKRKEICENIQKYLSKLLSKKSSIKLYMRLVPTCVHLLTLNGKIKESKEMRSELSQTMTSSMWDLYNHRDYDVAMNVSKKILEYESDNKEALYIKSLCLIRFNKLEEAYSIIKNLLKSNKNDARYFYAVGRIFKLKMNYEMAIKYFYDALEKKNSRYISAFRELAECYLCLGDTKKAIENVQKAKYIDNSNLFVILLEARILQKIGKLKEALEIVENLSRYEADPSLISFRKGRIYDEMGDINKAKEFYKESISFNKRSYDAKLCLLNIEIIDNNKDLEEEIFDLKSVLNGKKKYILLNIEARFYTYSKNDQEKAIEILNTVPELFRDRQWFAVMLQTLNNSKEEHLKSNRNILAQRADDKYRVVQNELQKRFGINNVYKSDFLPDI